MCFVKHAILVAGLASFLGPAASAQDLDAGAALFNRHCAICHGDDASGQGPMAPALLIQPPDLTRLAANNDGEFPRFRVISRIDGREPMVSHGSPMPVFGEFFEGSSASLKTQSGQPILTTIPIADLMAWLESIQR